jgi:hypothetical protein
MKENKMITAYKVEIEKLTFDMGIFNGYKLVGYYTNKAKAEKIAEERYNTRNRVVEGEIRITEIEIDDEE